MRKIALILLFLLFLQFFFLPSFALEEFAGPLEKNDKIITGESLYINTTDGGDIILTTLIISNRDYYAYVKKVTKIKNNSILWSKIYGPMNIGFKEGKDGHYLLYDYRGWNGSDFIELDDKGNQQWHNTIAQGYLESVRAGNTGYHFTLLKDHGHVDGGKYTGRFEDVEINYSDGSMRSYNIPNSFATKSVSLSLIVIISSLSLIVIYTARKGSR